MRALILAGVGVAACLAATATLRAQAPAGEDFPGIKAALTADQYAASGLGKLSAAERARLDAALKDYFSGASQRVADRAATQAVDRAVKENRTTTTSIIESRLVGTFTGWKDGTLFRLENGQRWKVIDGSRGTYPAVENPQVFIVRDAFGYKMAVLGGSTVRVRKL